MQITYGNASCRHILEACRHMWQMAIGLNNADHLDQENNNSLQEEINMTLLRK